MWVLFLRRTAPTMWALSLSDRASGAMGRRRFGAAGVWRCVQGPSRPQLSVDVRIVSSVSNAHHIRMWCIEFPVG